MAVMQFDDILSYVTWIDIVVRMTQATKSLKLF